MKKCSKREIAMKVWCATGKETLATWTKVMEHAYIRRVEVMLKVRPEESY